MKTVLEGIISFLENHDIKYIDLDVPADYRSASHWLTNIGVENPQLCLDALCVLLNDGRGVSQTVVFDIRPLYT